MAINYTFSAAERAFLASIDRSAMEQNASFLIKSAEKLAEHWKEYTISLIENCLKDCAEGDHLHLSTTAIHELAKTFFESPYYSSGEKHIALRTLRALTQGHGWDPDAFNHYTITESAPLALPHWETLSFEILHNNLASILLNPSYQEVDYWKDHDFKWDWKDSIHIYEDGSPLPEVITNWDFRVLKSCKTVERKSPRAYPQDVQAIAKHLISSEAISFQEKMKILSATLVIFREHEWNFNGLEQDIQIQWNEGEQPISTSLPLSFIIRIPVFSHQTAEADSFEETLILIAPAGTSIEDFHNFVRYYLQAPKDSEQLFSLPLPQFCALISVGHYLEYSDRELLTDLFKYVGGKPLTTVFAATNKLPQQFASQLLSAALTSMSPLYHYTAPYNLTQWCEMLQPIEHYQKARNERFTLDLYSRLPSQTEIETVLQTFPSVQIRIRTDFAKTHSCGSNNLFRQHIKPVPDIVALTTAFPNLQIVLGSDSFFDQSEIATINAITQQVPPNQIRFYTYCNFPSVVNINTETIKEQWPHIQII